MKNLDKKIISGLVVLCVCLVAFICFSKAGILFSSNDNNVIVVSTKNKGFDTSKYVATASIVSNYERKTKESPVQTTTKKVLVYSTDSWDGAVLSKSKGAIQGPSGKETYYNLNMSGVVSAMRYLGFNEEDYPYWVRDDGVKMLGDYVMVAASYNIRPKGSIISTSLGDAIVCDTGGFAQNNPTQVDVAVTW